MMAQSLAQVVIIPGGFHPFTPGHLALYTAAKKRFPGADIYLAATNDTSTRPFPFKVKQKLAGLAGIPANRFVQVTSPFSCKEITQEIKQPDTTALIFVRSEKDKNTQPTPGGKKKDGSDSYLQLYTGANMEPLTKHAYMAYLPVVSYAGSMTSATQIRQLWPTLDTNGKAELIHTLYSQTVGDSRLTSSVSKILDTTLLAPKQLLEAKWFRTQYGWAGGKKDDGGMYKHPDRIAADRKARAERAKEKAAANKKKDAPITEVIENPFVLMVSKKIAGQLENWLLKNHLGFTKRQQYDANRFIYKFDDKTAYDVATDFRDSSPLNEIDNEFDYTEHDARIRRLKQKMLATKKLLAKNKKPEPKLNPKTNKHYVDFGPDYLDEKP